MSASKTFGSVGILLLISLNPVWAAYKWTDKNNVTHYGQFPPRDKKAQKIDIKRHKTPDSLRKQAPATPDPRQRQPVEDKTRINAATDTRSAANDKNCAKAKHNLQILSHNKRIRIEDNGSYRVLSEKEREQQINGIKDRINATCQNNPQQQQD